MPKTTSARPLPLWMRVMALLNALLVGYLYVPDSLLGAPWSALLTRQQWWSHPVQTPLFLLVFVSLVAVYTTMVWRLRQPTPRPRFRPDAFRVDPCWERAMKRIGVGFGWFNLVAVNGVIAFSLGMALVHAGGQWPVVWGVAALVAALFSMAWVGRWLKGASSRPKMVLLCLLLVGLGVLSGLGLAWVTVSFGALAALKVGLVCSAISLSSVQCYLLTRTAITRRFAALGRWLDGQDDPRDGATKRRLTIPASAVLSVLLGVPVAFLAALTSGHVVSHCLLGLGLPSPVVLGVEAMVVVATTVALGAWMVDSLQQQLPRLLTAARAWFLQGRQGPRAVNVLGATALLAAPVVVGWSTQSMVLGVVTLWCAGAAWALHTQAVGKASLRSMGKVAWSCVAASSLGLMAWDHLAGSSAFLQWPMAVLSFLAFFGLYWHNAMANTPDPALASRAHQPKIFTAISSRDATPASSPSLSSASSSSLTEECEASPTSPPRHG